MGKRRSTIAKVRQKQKDPRDVKFRNKKIEASWNKDKTAVENYRSLGLRYSVNDICGSREFSKRINQWQSVNTAQVLEADIERGENEILDEIKQVLLPFEPPSNGPSILDGEQESVCKPAVLKPLEAYFVKLQEKYGTDYKKMAMDIELNFNQLSEGQIRRVFRMSAAK